MAEEMKKITKLGRRRMENKRILPSSQSSLDLTPSLFLYPLLRSPEEQHDARKTDYGDSPKTLDYDRVWPEATIFLADGSPLVWP